MQRNVQMAEDFEKRLDFLVRIILLPMCITSHRWLGLTCECSM